MKKVDEGYGHNGSFRPIVKLLYMMYYQYLDYLIRALATDAKSLIDVGSTNAQYIESFHWIPKRNTLDKIKESLTAAKT
jgi:hypothetical protein